MVDSAFESEYEAACRVGFPTGLYDHEAVESGDPRGALHRLADSDAPQRLILRGWMVPGEAYAGLYEQLVRKAYLPQTTPGDYEQAHYLPLSYPLIAENTAQSAWIEGDDVDAAWDLYRAFRKRDAIIKDWVKSAKTRWKDACFIPAETDEDRFREVYQAFRTERGKLFNRGVVLREFMPVVERGADIRGIPIIDETRLFFWKGQIIVRPDFREVPSLDDLPRWEEIARRFSSPFITIDVTQLFDGTTKIVEVGDGGVSGLPLGLDPDQFYQSLSRLTGE